MLLLLSISKARCGKQRVAGEEEEWWEEEEEEGW